jgi:hypothetical protein
MLEEGVVKERSSTVGVGEGRAGEVQYRSGRREGGEKGTMALSPIIIEPLESRDPND